MKSKLCLFLIMFLIWCLFNGCTMLVLGKLGYMDYNLSHIPVYVVTAFVFSAYAAIFQVDFKFTLVLILVAELCWLDYRLYILKGNENIIAGYEYITFFNCSFFALVTYLFKVGAYWFGYYDRPNSGFIWWDLGYALSMSWYSLVCLLSWYCLFVNFQSG